MTKQYVHLNDKQRDDLVDQCKRGKNRQAIAKAFNVNKKTVQRVYKRFLETNDFKRKKYTVRLRGVSEQEILDVRKAVQANDKLTLAGIRSATRSTRSLSCIFNILKRLGIKTYNLNRKYNQTKKQEANSAGHNVKKLKK